MTIKEMVLRHLERDPGLTPLQLQELVRAEATTRIVTLAQVSTIVREFKRDGVDGDGHEHE